MARLVVLAILTGAALVLPLVVQAQDRCGIDEFVGVETSTLGWAVVASAHDEKAYFYDLGAACSNGENQCRRRVYVVNGDRLLLSSRRGDFTCAYFVGAKRDTVGWIRSGFLTVQESAASPNSSWVGMWRSGRNSIEFSSDGNGSGLAMIALSIGSGDTAPATGYLEDTVSPKGRGIEYSDGDCSVTLTLVDRYLIANDNGFCGGVGVTFAGVYRRD